MKNTRDELLAAAELAIRARDKRIAQLEKRVAELEEAQEPKHDPERRSDAQ